VGTITQQIQRRNNKGTLSRVLALHKHKRCDLCSCVTFLVTYSLCVGCQTYHHDTHEWTNVERLRTRFGIEAPLAAGQNVWKAKTFYGIANVEPCTASTRTKSIRCAHRLVLAILRGRESAWNCSTTPNLGRVSPSNDLGFTQNIIRLNVKVGLKHSLLSHVWNPGEKTD